MHGKNDERKNLRPLVHGLYKKLQFCAPIRTKKQYESSEYHDPEPNDDREDLDKCPQEEFTETYVKENNGLAVALPVTVNVPDTIKKYDHISIAIVSTNNSDSDKLEKKIKNDTLHRMSHLNCLLYTSDAADE